MVWKVRVMTSEGLVEHEYDGPLADVEAQPFAATGAIMVVQRVGPPPKPPGAEDSAKGSDSIAVQKK